MGILLNAILNSNRSNIGANIKAAVKAQKMPSGKSDPYPTDVRNAISADFEIFFAQLRSLGHDTGNLARARASLLTQLIGEPVNIPVNKSFAKLSAELMAIPSEIYKAACDALIKGGVTLATSEATVDPTFPSDPEARIQWQPQTLGENYYLHPMHGIGRIIERRGDEMAVVQFNRKRVTVGLDSLTAVQAPEFDVIMQGRVEQFSDLAVILAPFVMNRFLPERFAGYGVNLSGDNRLRSLLKDATSLGSLPSAPIQEGVVRYALALRRLAVVLGIDPIAFALQLADGESVQDLIAGRSSQDVAASSRLEKGYGMHFTPDLIWGMLQHKLWQSRWQDLGQSEFSPVMVAGHLYAPDYQGSVRPDDLGDLYEAYRSGDDAAMRQVQELMAPSIQAWIGHHGRDGAVLVPISEHDSHQRLAQSLATSFGVKILSPWKSFPHHHDQNTTPMNRLRLGAHAFKVDSSKRESIAGSNVLFVGGRIGVGTSYVAARTAIHGFKPNSVGLAAVVRSVGTPNELTMKFGPRIPHR